MIIHLNGMPGTGKLTIARLVAQELEGRLVDNHSIIDEVTLEHEFDSQGAVIEGG